MNTTHHPFLEALKKVTLVKQDKSTHKGEELLKDREIILVYVGAGHLAGPSKRTLEGLKIFYKTINNSKELEVLYLSQDSSTKEFEKHFPDAHSDWFAVVPNTPDMADLMNHLDNPSPPHIYVFNKMGYLVRKTCGIKDVSDANAKETLNKWKTRTELVNAHKKNKESRESKESRDE